MSLSKITSLLVGCRDKDFVLSLPICEIKILILFDDEKEKKKTRVFD